MEARIKLQRFPDAFPPQSISWHFLLPRDLVELEIELVPSTAVAAPLPRVGSCTLQAVG